MKKLIILPVLLAIFVVASAFVPSGENTCDSKALKKEGIAKLDPFYYSSSKVSTIAYDYRVQRKEIAVPLFKGEKYRMVFNKANLPKDVIVEVYDKDKTHSGRTALFTTDGNSETLVSFEPKKSKKMYVNYLIPTAKGEKKTACLVFVLGYQLTFVKAKEETEEEITEE